MIDPHATPDRAAKFYEQHLLEAAPVREPEEAMFEWARNADEIIRRLQRLGWKIESPGKRDA